MKIARILLGTALAAVLVCSVTAGLWQVSKSMTYQFFGKIVHRVETSDSVVALTFDDGPTSRFTPGVLALLEQKKVRATFFLIGQDMAKAPEQARTLVEAGHELGNHTFTHSNMTLAGWDKVAREIEQTDALLRAAGQTGDILFRPPYGKKLFSLPLYLARNNRVTVTWDVAAETFSDVPDDPDRLVSDVLARTRPGSIVLLHPMYATGGPTREALPRIIDGLRERGFSFVTVSELLALQKKN